ncbi:MAG: endopeptidase La, partial [Paramuribaculum sp.]|nr:endopeptidase La [Paramuribaculum sp.]
NYLDVAFDLSHVLFVAPANSLSTIQQPLLDRMEVIDISGYLLEEKVEIARRHLIPRLLAQHEFEPSQLIISDEAIIAVIEGYTGESGVRQLDKKLAAIVRKAVIAKVEKRDFPTVVTPEMLRDLIGVAPYSRDRYQGNDYAGVVTGLAWTPAGGEILYVETSVAPGKGEKITITGQLGDVMKESAAIALQYVRSHAHSLGIDPRVFEQYQIHIHVPEGAIPKDGPSAGITLATSIASALTRRKVAPRIAMTGELTLRGLVLPVGGIKEKILAAKRAGVRTIILSEENRKNIEEIPANYLDGLTFEYVKDVSKVLDIALTDEIVGEPIAVS